ncbi:MAG TPA: hypothetical protein VLV18_07485, partial [Terriglobales bacterium]|nr:hypothetical protein [Terriglobales bacterium]
MPRINYGYGGFDTMVKGENLGRKESAYFIDTTLAQRLTQVEGLETSILSGLQGEKMMMVLTTTLPGHTAPLHSHPHEQIGM